MRINSRNLNDKYSRRVQVYSDALNVEKIRTLYYFISLTKNEIASNHKKERTRKFRYPNINKLKIMHNDIM